MRIAFDGLPRDLPLTHDERKRLRVEVRAKSATIPNINHDGRMRAALIPGLVAFALMNLWMVLLWTLAPPWSFLAPLGCLMIQLPLSMYIMRCTTWPVTWRAMAACGYEVCRRCTFPLKDCPPEQQNCPECGAARLDPTAPVSRVGPTPPP